MEHQILYYGISRNVQEPLDVRQKINSLSTIDIELPLQIRYEGLIFYVKDEGILFILESDLESYFKLSDYINLNLNYGIGSNNYSNLISDLNNNNVTNNLGKIITVFPLGVSFIYDGSNWIYHSGVYKVQNDTELNTIALSLRSEGKLLLINNVRHIFKSDLSKSTELIILNSIPTIFDNNRYFEINEILYYSINNKLYKLSEKIKIIQNQVLNIETGNANLNIINHNLNSIYIEAYLRININNGILFNTKMIKLDFIEINSNSIQIFSEFDIIGDLLLIGN